MKRAARLPELLRIVSSQRICLSGNKVPRKAIMAARQHDATICGLNQRRPANTKTMTGRKIYCMFLLVQPYCQIVVGAWQSFPTLALVSHHQVAARRRQFSLLPPVTVIRRMSHTKLEQDTEVNAKENSLLSQIRDAYELSETDGILNLASRIRLHDYLPRQLVQTSIEAAKGAKGMAAGIMNAWIGACFQLEGEGGVQYALDLLEAYDDASIETQIYPDIVTLSLVYTIACEQEEYRQVAEKLILERAVRMSKKQGGSKRRKELAAARRRGPPVSCMSVASKLQDLYGSDLKVLQESNDLVVLSKPSGMVCFHKNKTTAGKARRQKSKGNKNNKMADVSLVDALLDLNVPLSTLNPEGRGLVHRIDRGTSGCLVLAKTDNAHAKLVTQFFLRRVNKSYTAVVSSSNPIESSKGEMNMPVHGRPARSRYTVLERNNDGTTTKLKMETLTGRKHQVRVHCAEGLQSPILFDPIYGTQAEANGRFLLHASSLSIPEFGIDVEAPIPSWWEGAVDETQAAKK